MAAAYAAAVSDDAGKNLLLATFSYSIRDHRRLAVAAPAAAASAATAAPTGAAAAAAVS